MEKAYKDTEDKTKMSLGFNKYGLGLNMFFGIGCSNGHTAPLRRDLYTSSRGVRPKSSTTSSYTQNTVEMADTGIVRDTITYSAAISACEKGGKVERAG